MIREHKWDIIVAALAGTLLAVCFGTLVAPSTDVEPHVTPAEVAVNPHPSRIPLLEGKVAQCLDAVEVSRANAVANPDDREAWQTWLNNVAGGRPCGYWIDVLELEKRYADPR